MFRKIVHNSLASDQRKGRDGMLFSYLTQLWDRPFENIDQEWELARRKPGIPRRVHSDSKSTGRGLYSMYFSYKRASQSTGGPDMRTIYLMDGGDWCKSNILVEAEVTDVEILDGKAFKGVLREILEHAEMDESMCGRGLEDDD